MLMTVHLIVCAFYGSLNSSVFIVLMVREVMLTGTSTAYCVHESTLSTWKIKY